MSEQTPKPYHRDEKGWVWRGSMMVYPFSTSDSVLDALNFAYGHGYEDAMTQTSRPAGDVPIGTFKGVPIGYPCQACAGTGTTHGPAPDVDAIAREAAAEVNRHNCGYPVHIETAAAIIREAIERARNPAP
jgi:hypothetical protein